MGAARIPKGKNRQSVNFYALEFYKVTNFLKPPASQNLKCYYEMLGENLRSNLALITG